PAPGEDLAADRGPGPGGAQRGLRGPGARLRPGAAPRPGPAERERRGHRPGASHRRHRRAHLGHAPPRDGPPQGAPGPGHAVHQRRHGPGGVVRGGLMEDILDADAPATPRSYAFIQFSTADGVARLVLNRPPANVLSVEVLAEINHALDSLEYQREVKLLVVSAAGKYFSAGFELQDHLGDRAYLMLEEFRKIFEQLGKFDKPTLAVVAGPALGAGSILAAGCDVALAGASARFGHPEIKGGVFNPVAAALLPRLVGRKKAMEILLLGGLLTAAEAER